MRNTSLTVLLLLLACVIRSEDLFAQIDYTALNDSYNQEEALKVVDQLRESFGEKKKFPEQLSTQVLIALAHYPELRKERIKFKFNKGKIAHTSKPIWYSLLIPFSKKAYLITISEKVKEGMDETMFSKLSYNAQIGVLGHELAHTVYYTKMNKISLIGLAKKYAKEEFRTDFERDTDKATIEHQLGFQLKQWSSEVHMYHIEDGRGEMYLSPEEIDREMMTP